MKPARAILATWLLAACWPGSALASDTSPCKSGFSSSSEEPAPGIQLVTETCETPLYRASIAVIDLASDEHEIITTPGNLHYTAVEEFGRTTGALLAVNGGFYGTKHGGWFMSGGKEKGKFVDNEFTAVAAFGKNLKGKIRAEIFPPEQVMPKGGGAPGWIHYGLTGIPMIVREGAVISELPPDDFTLPVEDQGTEIWDTPNPRTAIGLTEDGLTLIVVVVDGRQPTLSKGMKVDQLASFMARLGAWNALNLDGGCSSAMYLGSKDALVSSPCVLKKDPTIRTVATHLAVVPLDKKAKLVSRLLLGGAALWHALAG